MGERDDVKAQESVVNTNMFADLHTCPRCGSAATSLWREPHSDEAFGRGRCFNCLARLEVLSSGVIMVVPEPVVNGVSAKDLRG